MLRAGTARPVPDSRRAATSDSPWPFAPLTRTFANCLRTLTSIGRWRGHTNANDDNATPRITVSMLSRTGERRARSRTDPASV